MTSVPRYEGNSDQMHGSHFSGEPINRSHDTVRPTPEHGVGDTTHLPSPESGLTGYALAACVEPLARVGMAQQAVTDVRVEFL